MKVNLGIPDKDRAKVIAILQGTLADTSLLYTKTRNAHWNVVGTHFHDLHKLFEAQYSELGEAVDSVAERIRALGGTALGSLAEFLKHGRLKEISGKTEHGKFWVDAVLKDHEQVIRQLRKDVDATDKLGDAGTSDFLTGLLEDHEKTAWMLRAFLE